MLQIDLGVSCNSAQHRAIEVYAAVFILVYPFGIPALFGWLLWKSKHDDKAEQQQQQQPALRLGLSREGGTIGFSDLSRFLRQDYGEHAHYFEVFECGRRLLLTGAPLFFLDDKISQVAAGMLLCLIAMCIFINFNPFRVPSDSVVGAVAQVALTMTFFAALLFKCDVPSADDYDEAAFGFVLVLLNLVLIASVGWAVGTTTRTLIASELKRESIVAQMERERGRASIRCARAVAKERRASQKRMHEEQKTLELIDLRRQDQEESDQKRQVAAAHQLDLFEHASRGSDGPFAFVVPDDLFAWLTLRAATADANTRPKRQHWKIAMRRFSGMSGLDIIRQAGQLSNVDRVKWIRGGTTEAPLSTRLTAANGVAVRMCLAAMHFGWFCKLWQSLEEGADPLMDWVCVSKLGEGAFGVAFLVKNRHKSNQQKAIKFVDCSSGDMQHVKHTIREIELQMAAHSEFVVRVDSWKVVQQRFLWVLMECCCGGELAAKLVGGTRSEHVDEEMLWHWITQLCYGMRDVHAAGVIHRDLKPENVLLDADDNVRIADFGLAGRLAAPGDTFTDFWGTPSFMAPEVRALAPNTRNPAAAARGYDFRADVFSLGVMMYQMSCPNGCKKALVHMTLPQFSSGEVTQECIAASLTTLDENGVDYSPRIRRVLQRALVLRPQHRATSEELALLLAAETDVVPNPLLSGGDGVDGRSRERTMTVFTSTGRGSSSSVMLPPPMNKKRSMSSPDINSPESILPTTQAIAATSDRVAML